MLRRVGSYGLHAWGINIIKHSQPGRIADTGHTIHLQHAWIADIDNLEIDAAQSQHIAHFEP